MSAQGSSGWLGPDDRSRSKNGDQYWGPSNAMQALYQYAEGRRVRGDVTGARNAARAVRLHLLEQRRRMRAVPLASWAQARWIDMALTAEWLLDFDDELRGAEREAILQLIPFLREQVCLGTCSWPAVGWIRIEWLLPPVQHHRRRRG